MHTGIVLAIYFWHFEGHQQQQQAVQDENEIVLPKHVSAEQGAVTRRGLEIIILKMKGKFLAIILVNFYGNILFACAPFSLFLFNKKKT